MTAGRVPSGGGSAGAVRGMNTCTHKRFVEQTLATFFYGIDKSVSNREKLGDSSPVHAARPPPASTWERALL